MTYDPNARFGACTVTVAPSPATTGTSLTVDVHGSDPFAGVTPPYYVLLRPAPGAAHQRSSETALVTASTTGTRTGTVAIEVLQDGYAGQGSASVETTQNGGGGTNETQALTLSADGGTFTLSFLGVTTGALAYNAADATIQAALNGLASVSNYATATVAETAIGGPGANEQQTITINAAGGTFTLTLDGQTTGALAWNASDAVIQSALEGLSTIGVGNVSVSSKVATFQGDLAALPVSLLVANGAALTGSGSVTVLAGVVTFGGGLMAGVDVAELVPDGTLLTLTTAGRNEKHYITVNADGGTFTLTFGANTTTALAYNATAAAVQAALRLLASIGAGNVNVTGDNGGPYTVEFVSGKANQNLATITASPASLTLNTRVFSPITRAQKGSTARSVVVGDTIEVATLPDATSLSVTLSASQNNWYPSGAASAGMILISTTGAAANIYDLTGLGFGADGREVTLLHVGDNAGLFGTPSVVLRNEHTSSTAANRFTIADDIPLPYRIPVTVIYDATAQRWRLRSVGEPTGGFNIGGPIGETLNVSTQPLVIVDSSGGAVTVALPANPAHGQRFVIVDQALIVTPNVTVTRNGKLIDGLAANFSLTYGEARELVFSSISGSWHSVGKLGRMPDMTRATRDALTPDTGELVHVSDGIRAMIYDGTASGWQPLSLIGRSMRRSHWQSEEFTFAPSDTADQNLSEWVRSANVAAGATPPALTAIASETRHPGIHRLATGNGTGAGLSERWPTTAGVFTASGSLYFGALVRVPTLSVLADRFAVIVGLIDGTTAVDVAATVNGIYFGYRDDIAAAWRAITAAASTRTSTGSGVTVTAGAWTLLEFVVNAAGTSVGFHVNGSLVVTQTLTIPASTVLLIPTISILKALGTTSRTLEVDRADVWGETSADRA